LRTGWSPEDISNVPQDIADQDDDFPLPAEFSLENKFPPIASQGQYGTCAAWAAGYNMKTALNAIEKGWSASDLENPANQTSPTDAWMITPSGGRNSDGACEGAYLTSIMQALVDRGALSLAEVPYSMMGSSCMGTSNGDANNRLANYRVIANNRRLCGGLKTFGLDLANFKRHIAQGKPVVIGALVGDRFMEWSGGEAISSDSRRRGGHAMVVSGYDDGRKAFRVRNSWIEEDGRLWGDEGSIWVDYDFFLSDFVCQAFVAENPKTQPFLGKQMPSKKQTALYIYYNAYNANEYEILFEGSYVGNADIPCAMPEITGDYYLAAFLDDGGLYFISAEGGKPLKFENGVMQSAQTVAAASVVELGELNGYAPKEIRRLIERDKRSGAFAKKLAEFRKKNSAPL
jgi:hypothetical protein